MRKIPLPVRGPRMALVVGSRVYVTSYAQNRVVRMRWPECDAVEATARVHRPRGVVWLRDRLYVACYGNPVGRVVSLDPETMEATHAFYTYRPRGIAAWNDTLLVTQVNRGRIVQCDPATGQVLRRWTGLREPRDVCVHGDTMYVASTANDAVVSVSLATSARTTLRCVRRPNGVASNGVSTVVTQWHAGCITVFTPGSVVARTYRAARPCMASIHQDAYLVCDDAADCVYVIRM